DGELIGILDQLETPLDDPIEAVRQLDVKWLYINGPLMRDQDPAVLRPTLAGGVVGNVVVSRCRSDKFDLCAQLAPLRAGKLLEQLRHPLCPAAAQERVVPLGSDTIAVAADPNLGGRIGTHDLDHRVDPIPERGLSPEGSSRRPRVDT